MITAGKKAGHYASGQCMADGRRVTGKRPSLVNGQRMVRLTFDRGPEWFGRADRPVPDAAPRTPGAIAVTAGATRGGRSLPQQELFAALSRPRRKRVGTQDGYERLLEKMTY